MQPEIPFGDKYFHKVQISEKGLIYFGDDEFVLQSAVEPLNATDVPSVPHAVLAPFWDNFQTTLDNAGRVYFKVNI